MKNTMLNLKEKTTNLDVKKIVKVSSAGALALILLGGGSAFAYKMYDNSQESKERQAQTSLVQNQAKADNISLKSQDDIKKVVAQTIGTDVASVTFREISLSNGLSDKGKGGKGKNREDSNRENRNTEINSTSVHTSATPKYVYNVQASANSMDYRFKVDAETGRIITSKVKK